MAEVGEAARSPALESADSAGEDQVQDLADALAARDNFIAAVSHELRNNVAPLILLAEQFEVLGASMRPEQIATKTALLTRNLRKFVATVDRVTEVAQLRDGKLELELTHCDFASIVRDVVAQLVRQAAAGGVELVANVPTQVVGTWDRVRLAQITTSFVTNAIRYGVGGEVEIALVQRGDEVELSVRDHGPGISVAELPGIFDRFDHRRSRTTGGFGVGLFIAKTLAAAMGGHVRAANAAGGGARFSVVLPRG
ncbi:MAG TPA: HAMP domain-containing sensor histidine kinase [Kofleriaceae bacterium]|jgi:signal transduction histidine kinase|nr:HAMP domain-containing sensor histidine kinase [Kofleriaceae bacterium]